MFRYRLKHVVRVTNMLRLEKHQAWCYCNHQLSLLWSVFAGSNHFVKSKLLSCNHQSPVCFHWKVLWSWTLWKSMVSAHLKPPLMELQLIEIDVHLAPSSSSPSSSSFNKSSCAILKSGFHNCYNEQHIKSDLFNCLGIYNMYDDNTLVLAITIHIIISLIGFCPC